MSTGYQIHVAASYNYIRSKVQPSPNVCVQTTLNGGLASVMYVNTGSTTEPTNNGWNPLPFTYEPLSTANGSMEITTSGPANCSALPIICTACQHKMMDDVVLDSLSYPIDSVQATEINKQRVFNEVARYDSLRTDDTNLNNFYNNNVSGNIGTLYSIQKYIREGYYSEANDEIASFTPR